jgi:P27 family predicted phage terminase small subunit
MRGRKPKEIQQVDLTLPPVGDPPDHLPDEAKKLWRRVVELWGRHLRELDRLLLERYCHAYMLMRRAAEYLLYRRGDKDMTYNKAVSLWRATSEEMRKAEEQMGLSPQSRARLFKAMPQQSKLTGNALMEFLKNTPPVGERKTKERKNAARK